MATSLKLTTGSVDFDVEGTRYKTWYSLYGDLRSGVTPVVGLHGGPGATHNYLVPLMDLTARYSIPLVLYDQLGNGQSTHPHAADNSFWTEDLFLKELDNLLSKLGIRNNYSLLGHSWGGMLAARHAAAQPLGLKKLVLSDSPASIPLFVKAAVDELIPQLPEDVQNNINSHEADGTTEVQEYKDAVQEYYKHFLCRLPVWPQEMVDSFNWIDRDSTVYNAMNGPCEIHIQGNLKDWSIVHDAHKIKVPTLLLNGAYDAATDNTLLPYVEKIPEVEWFKFTSSSHMPLWEEREKYMEVVAGFLLGK